MRRFGSIEEVVGAALSAWCAGRDRGNGRMARWRDIRLRDLAELSNRLILVKYGDGAMPQLRYRGQELDDVFGPRSPAIFTAGPDRDLAVQTHHLCLSHPCGAIIRRRIDYFHAAGSLTPVDIDLAFLPALDDDGEADLLMAFCSFDAPSVGVARKMSRRIRVHLHRIDYFDIGFGTPGKSLTPDIVTEIDLP